MKAFRALLVAVIILDIALLAVAAPLRQTLARYDLAGKRRELDRVEMENRALLEDLARARRPEQVAARAAELGVEVRPIDLDSEAPPEGGPTVRAPRR